MKSLIALGCLALPLAAQEAREARPAFVELHVDQPLKGLKDSVGNGAGMGANLGYVFHAQKGARWCHTLSVKVDSDEFADRATQREAHGIGIGPELTLYFGPECKGAFFSAEVTLYAWSLTNRNSGALQNQSFLRSGGALSIGYRFRNGYSVEALWKSATVDSDLRMESLGLGFRLNF